MAALGVPGPVPEGPIEAMSYGRQKTIELARAFLNPVDLLVLDEPLNFIDIDARELIEDAVVTDAPTLVFVEHDASFVGRVATRRIELVPPAREDTRPRPAPDRVLDLEVRADPEQASLPASFRAVGWSRQARVDGDYIPSIVPSSAGAS